jgi:transposase InsO family protein
LYPAENKQYYPLGVKSVKVTDVTNEATDIPTVSRPKPVNGLDLITEFDEPLEEYRQNLLEKEHLMGHFGAEALIQALKNKGINWPGMTVQAQAFVKKCLQCQRHTVQRKGYHPITAITASMPGDHYAIDLAGPFATTDRGNHYLFVLVDICTRFCQLKAITDKSAAVVATALMDVCCSFGFPRILQSDNGSEFVNSLITEIKKHAGFEHRLITPYHPQANGTAERWVGMAVKAIIKRCNGVRRDWDLYVMSTQLALNLKVSARHHSTPFSLMFARTANGFGNFFASHDLTGTFDEGGVPLPATGIYRHSISRYNGENQRLHQSAHGRFREKSKTHNTRRCICHGHQQDQEQ